MAVLDIPPYPRYTKGIRLISTNVFTTLQHLHDPHGILSLVAIIDDPATLYHPKQTTSSAFRLLP